VELKRQKSKKMKDRQEEAEKALERKALQEKKYSGN